MHQVAMTTDTHRPLPVITSCPRHIDYISKCACGQQLLTPNGQGSALIITISSGTISRTAVLSIWGYYTRNRNSMQYYDVSSQPFCSFCKQHKGHNTQLCQADTVSTCWCRLIIHKCPSHNRAVTEWRCLSAGCKMVRVKYVDQICYITE